MVFRTPNWENMADLSAPVNNEKDTLSKKLKRNFDSWRDVVILIHSVLLWEKRPYPWIVAGIPTVIFLQLYYYSPSLLTVLSLFCLIVAILDYVGPIVSSALWKQENWTPSKERQLESICKSLASGYLSVRQGWISMLELRSNRPGMFYPIASVILSVLAWVGDSINNLLITYFVVMAALVMPGLIHYGILEKYYKAVAQKVANLLHGMSTNPKKTQ